MQNSFIPPQKYSLKNLGFIFSLLFWAIFLSCQYYPSGSDGQPNQILTSKPIAQPAGSDQAQEATDRFLKIHQSKGLLDQNQREKFEQLEDKIFQAISSRHAGLSGSTPSGSYSGSFQKIANPKNANGSAGLTSGSGSSHSSGHSAPPPSKPELDLTKRRPRPKRKNKPTHVESKIPEPNGSSELEVKALVDTFTDPKNEALLAEVDAITTSILAELKDANLENHEASDDEMLQYEQQLEECIICTEQMDQHQPIHCCTTCKKRIHEKCLAKFVIAPISSQQELDDKIKHQKKALKNRVQESNAVGNWFMNATAPASSESHLNCPLCGSFIGDFCFVKPYLKKKEDDMEIFKILNRWKNNNWNPSNLCKQIEDLVEKNIDPTDADELIQDNDNMTLLQWQKLLHCHFLCVLYVRK